MFQHVLHFIVVVEQTVAIKPFQTALLDLSGSGHKAIGADDLRSSSSHRIKVQIVIVVTVGVPTLPLPSSGAKRNLAQASQLAQQEPSSCPLRCHR